MEVTINFESDSVSYEDIGSERKTRVAVRRVSKPRRKGPQPRDRSSVMKRKLSNLRGKIKGRLDTINGVMGKKRPTDSSKTAKIRQELRTLFQDYKRTKMMVDRISKPKKKA